MVVVDGSELLRLDLIVLTFKKSSEEHGRLLCIYCGGIKFDARREHLDVAVRC